jgi:hypothetical protein
MQNSLLTAEAKREQEQNVAERGRIFNERARFELAREKLYLGLGLLLVALLMSAAIVLWASGQEDSALYLLGSSGIGGVALYLIGRQR